MEAYGIAKNCAKSNLLFVIKKYNITSLILNHQNMSMPEKGGSEPIITVEPLISGSVMMLFPGVAELECRHCPGNLRDINPNTLTIECAVLNAMLAGDIKETSERIATVLENFGNPSPSSDCPPIRVFKKLRGEL